METNSCNPSKYVNRAPYKYATLQINSPDTKINLSTNIDPSFNCMNITQSNITSSIKK